MDALKKAAPKCLGENREKLHHAVKYRMENLESTHELVGIQGGGGDIVLLQPNWRILVRGGRASVVASVVS